MRTIFGLAALGGIVLVAKRLYDARAGARSVAPPAQLRSAPGSTGHDTPTGTDPHAKWSAPGYEDESLGQVVAQDERLADRLVAETGGDLEETERRFAREAAGAPAIARQDDESR